LLLLEVVRAFLRDKRVIVSILNAVKLIQIAVWLLLKLYFELAVGLLRSEFILF